MPSGYLPGISDADELAGSLDLLAELDPHLVVSSAFAGDAGVQVVSRAEWARCVSRAQEGLDDALR